VVHCGQVLVCVRVGSPTAAQPYVPLNYRLAGGPLFSFFWCYVHSQVSSTGSSSNSIAAT